MVSLLGKYSRSTPTDSSAAISASRVRGYLFKSSLAPNCMGLTKILQITVCACLRASRIKVRCPSCKLPIVGTNATRPSCFASCVAIRSCSSCSIIFMLEYVLPQETPLLLLLKHTRLMPLARYTHQLRNFSRNLEYDSHSYQACRNTQALGHRCVFLHQCQSLELLALG